MEKSKSEKIIKMEDFNENPAVKFYKDMIDDNQDEHHRYKSWEPCYNFFQNEYEKIKNIFQENHKNTKEDDELVDHACLHLSFYLASWGMYRGSGFLLNKDYKCHKYALEVLVDEEYYDLWDLNFNTLSEDDNKIPLIFELKDKIKAAYGNNLKEAEKVKYLFDLNLDYKEYLVEKKEINDELVNKFVDGTKSKINIKEYSIKKDGKDWKIIHEKKKKAYRIEETGGKLKVYKNQSINPTDTLISKILMGTMGCVPAYDRLFINGLKEKKLDTEKNNKFSYHFNETSFKKLVEFCKNNKKEIEEIQKYILKNRKIAYPIMKIIDMYFWYIGFTNNKENK